MAEALEKFQEDKALIVELGLMAIKQGDEDSARKIFEAAELFGVAKSSKHMGLGLIAIHKLDIPEAQKHFQAVLKETPDDGRALSFMAFTHMLAVMETDKDSDRVQHLKKSAEMAKKALEHSAEPSTKEMAQSILNWENELQHLELES